MGQFPKTPMRDLFTAASPDCLNLLSKCLIYDPRKRISAKDVSLPLSSHGRQHLMLCSTIGTVSSVLHCFTIPYPSIEAAKTSKERVRDTTRRGGWECGI